MPWQRNGDSKRKKELPSYSEWQKLRNAVRKRAGEQCERYTDGVRCSRLGTDCNHIGDNRIHEVGNLEWLCVTCHKEFTAKQAEQAKRRIRQKLKHPWEVERHPGLIAGGRNASSKTRLRAGKKE